MTITRSNMDILNISSRPDGSPCSPSRFSGPGSGGSSGIWVFAEHENGKLHPVVYELLGEAKRLAVGLGGPGEPGELGEPGECREYRGHREYTREYTRRRERGAEVACVVLGVDIDSGPEADMMRSLEAYGVDTIYVVENDIFSCLQDEPCAAALAELASRYNPSILLIGATALGRSVAPSVAARLDTGLTAECVELDIDRGSRLLIQTRPAFGANIMASITCPIRRPQMATVRPGILGLKGLGGLDSSDSGFAGYHCHARIMRVDVDISKPRVRVIERVVEACEGNNLADAEIIVAGGRGVGSVEDFALIRELACALGGAVGATRPVVDAGWAPESSLIGQTGRIVSPRLYIACGISGAIQHMVGVSADVIVAINKDAGAPIFRSATYGIVGDVVEVIPALLDEVKNA